jgi:hypothetical protein
MRLKSMLKRLFDKIVHDALPAGLASLIGGLLLTHFQIAQTPQPTTVRVTPASPEMMQLLRDEHVAIVDFVRGQAASDKNRGVAEPEPQHGVAEAVPASVAQVAPVPIPRPSVTAALRPAAVRGKTPLVGASAPTPAAAPVPTIEAAAQPAARADDSLLAKTIGVKDRVVSATTHAVSATIGIIPSWFGSVGDRIGGDGQSPRPPAELVNASWIMSGAAER